MTDTREATPRLNDGGGYPDKIWATSSANYGAFTRYYASDLEHEGDGYAEYVRSDLVTDLKVALRNLVNAKAISGVREMVAGWNGENRPDGPYVERHPSRLGATLPKTDCGSVYELDEAMQAARALLSKLEASHGSA